MIQPSQTPAALTDREFEVLELIAGGCKNAEIAFALDIQEVTVRFHVGKIVKKLGVKNRTEAACLAIQNDWIKLKSKTIVKIVVFRFGIWYAITG